MKTIYLFVIFLFFCFCSHAQKGLLDHTFQSQKRSAPVLYYLDEIGNRTGIVIEYSPNHVDVNAVLELDGTEQTVGALLRKIQFSQPVRLIEKNGKILIAPAASIAPQPMHGAAFYGFVVMAESREPLIDVSILDLASGEATYTNASGYFNLLLSKGRHRIVCSYVGFKPQVLDIDITGAERREIVLQPKEEQAAPVIIAVSRNDHEQSEPMNQDDYSLFNYFLGENDPFRSVYRLPGVKNVPESFNGVLVRGGGANENLFLLDGNEVYNPTHMLGAISIINPTTLKKIRLYKSDFPARLGGAIGSVIDVHTKDGNMKELHGEANAGLLAGSFSMEAPLVKNKTAMIMSFRHSWPVHFLNFFRKNLQPDFYDVQFRITHKMGTKDKLMLNLYKGKDQIRQTDKRIDNIHQWGNLVGSLAWNHLVGSRSFITSSVNMSLYDNLGGFQFTLYDSSAEQKVIQTRSLGTFSSIRNFNFKTAAEVFISNQFKINAGGKGAYCEIRPFETRISTELQDSRNAFTAASWLSYKEVAAYAEAEIKPGKRFFIRPGLHISGYHFERYTNLSVQPRFYATYQDAARRQRFFVSLNSMVQYLHMVANPYLGPNSDIWIPSTASLKPEKSFSVSGGYERKISRDIRISVEAYYKEMHHVTNYSEGKSYFIHSKNWHQNIESGTGTSYGSEWFVEKKGNKLQLYGSYTLAWSFRKFRSINAGNRFPYKYDRRHDLNLGCSYKYNSRFSSTAVWTFATGDMFSFPDQIYPDYDRAQQIESVGSSFDNYRFIYFYSGVNQYRTAPYQRLDIAVNYRTRNDKLPVSQITAGVYNLNGAPAQYSYDLKGSLQSSNVMIEVKRYAFTITPYVSYTLKF